MASIKTKIARLLTGASLTALSITAVRGSAIAATQTVTVPVDHVNITTDLTTFTNETTIGPGQANPLFPYPPQAVAVDVTSHAAVSVINNTAHAAITARASGYALTGHALGIATALRIDGVAPTINNAGLIQAFASANNLDSGIVVDGLASAYAHGINYVGPNNESAVINTGAIVATAFAHALGDASDTFATAYAQAVGMRQAVTGLGTGPASASVVNTGFIGALAAATATGSSHDAVAIARARGIDQAVENATVGQAFVSNPAGHTIAASAYAFAHAFGSGASAYADARATGVHQFIGVGTPIGLASVNNSGNINAFASAFAIASSGDATAHARAEGVHQNITAATALGGPGLEGQAVVSNSPSGVILAVATAHALASESAFAQAKATGVSQRIANVGSAVFSHPNTGIASAVVNNAGLIEGLANAQAGGFFTAAGSFVAVHTARASATAYGVKQRIDGSVNSFLSVTNFGQILGVAHATATAVTGAEAFANAVGVRQSIEGDTVGMQAVATVHNSSTGIIAGLAHAQATAYEALAVASATGVRQVLDHAILETATVINNDAQIIASAQAVAVATSGYGFGLLSVAEARAIGVHQDASTAAAAVETVTNSNHGVIFAKAHATADTAYIAFAAASANGVRQDGFDTTSFTAVVTNDPTSLIAGSAYAAAFATFAAVADAFAAGVEQNADEFHVASLSVSNSGFIQGFAAAFAAATVVARASASAVGVRQEAEDTLSPGGAAFALVTNQSTGEIQALANAQAFASESAYAHASAIGVSQSAHAITGAVDFAVTNAGLIDAQATAYASAYFHASAHAYAAGVLQAGTAIDGAFNAAVTNSGFIGGNAKATAVAASFATAQAYGVGVSQYAVNVLSANFNVQNSGTISGQAAALAVAIGGSTSGRASAYATAFGVRQFASDAGAFAAAVTNTSSGVIQALAKASAKAAFTANAFASAYGVAQTAVDVGAANLAVSNAGHIAAQASAHASAFTEAFASAYAVGVFQGAFGAGPVTASVTNSGEIGALAKATAVAASSATAHAFAAGVSQYAVDSASANLSVTNTGHIGAQATAYAISTEHVARASAIALGVAQQGSAIGSMVATVNNNSAGAIIAASAKANASAFSSAHAFARATGVEQFAEDVGEAVFTVNNSGHIHAVATALAFAATGFADASALAEGIFQDGNTVASMNALVTNNKGASIFATANALAHGGTDASADARAFAVSQVGHGAQGAFTVNNSGVIGARAQASATGGSAFAQAAASGVFQEPDFAAASATVDNSGVISAVALAKAVGTAYASATAFAAGIDVLDPRGDTSVNLNINNSGKIFAFASAVAAGAATNYANATAAGIIVFADFEIDGTVTNSGGIFATAKAAASSGFAHAVGIWENSPSNNSNIVNTGLINAYAQVPNTALGAFATGILISGAEITANGSHVVVNPNAKTTITNDGGTIWAGISQDGGKTIQRGNAINTTGVAALDISPAPNPVTIQLEGTEHPGHIFGDILIGVHDEIDVLNGKTFFDGIVNNPNKVTDPFVGKVNIEQSGTLVLCQEGWTKACDAGAAAWASAGPGGAGYNPANGTNGPAYVFANTFSNSGTLAYQLTPQTPVPSNFTGVFTDPSFTTPATFVPGNYSQVFATTATLGGTLQIVFLPGLYNNTTTYSHIVEGGTVNGNFANVVDNSILLTPTPVVHNGSPGFVDLVVTRTPFNAVAGETQNEQRVGGGIENVFNQLPIGTDVFKGNNKFDQLVATLFTIDNAHTFGQALDQLSGAQFAQELQSVIWSTREINKTIAGRMDCMLDSVAVYGANGGGADAQGGGADMPVKAPPRPAPVYTGCYVPGHWTVWAQGHGSWNHDDGDSNAPGYKETQYGAYIGADYALTPNWFIGIAGGYFNSNMNFDQFGGVGGGSIRYSGGQVAGYGGYDDRVWYGRAIVSAGFYTANSNRFISITGSPVDPTGKPDADVVSFYGEAGYHWYVAPTTTITPLLGLTVAHGWLNSFTENDDGTGAGLNIHDSNGTSVATRLGARFSTTAWGVWRPELMVAWQHEFDDTTQTVNASFADAPGSNFSVLSSNTPRDWAVVEAGVTYFVNPNNKFSVLYNGFLNQDYTSNSVVGRWTTKW